MSRDGGGGESCDSGVGVLAGQVFVVCRGIVGDLMSWIEFFRIDQVDGLEHQVGRDFLVGDDAYVR